MVGKLISFQGQLASGKVAESRIARFLRSRGNAILPIYEPTAREGKGPRLLLNDRDLIAPDLLIWNEGKVYWIEAKHKTAFTWHRKTQRWVTGIDLYQYEHYLQVAKNSPFPVWLLFLHEGGHAKDSPEVSPAGLFGQDIEVLKNCQNHQHNAHGKSGMVYWWVDSLKRFANLQDIPE